MSNFTQEVSKDLVHIKIGSRSATDVVVVRICDSVGDVLSTHLTDLDHLGNLSFDINSAIQDREIWKHEQTIS